MKTKILTLTLLSTLVIGNAGAMDFFASLQAAKSGSVSNAVTQRLETEKKDLESSLLSASNVNMQELIKEDADKGGALKHAVDFYAVKVTVNLEKDLGQAVSDFSDALAPGKTTSAQVLDELNKALDAKRFKGGTSVVARAQEAVQLLDDAEKNLAAAQKAATSKFDDTDLQDKIKPICDFFGAKVPTNINEIEALVTVFTDYLAQFTGKPTNVTDLDAEFEKLLPKAKYNQGNLVDQIKAVLVELGDALKEVKKAEDTRDELAKAVKPVLKFFALGADASDLTPLNKFLNGFSKNASAGTAADLMLTFDTLLDPANFTPDATVAERVQELLADRDSKFNTLSTVAPLFNVTNSGELITNTEAFVHAIDAKAKDSTQALAKLDAMLDPTKLTSLTKGADVATRLHEFELKAADDVANAHKLWEGAMIKTLEPLAAIMGIKFDPTLESVAEFMQKINGKELWVGDITKDKKKAVKHTFNFS
jgi:hypothetical protein